MFWKVLLASLVLLSVVQATNPKCIESMLQTLSSPKQQMFPNLKSDLEEKSLTSPLDAVLVSLELLVDEKCKQSHEAILPISEECLQSMHDAANMFKKLLASSNNAFVFAINLSMFEYTYESSIKTQCGDLMEVIDLKAIFSRKCITQIVKDVVSYEQVSGQSDLPGQYSHYFEKGIKTLEKCGEKEFADQVAVFMKKDCFNPLLVFVAQVAKAIKMEGEEIQNRLPELEILMEKTYSQC